MDNNRQILENAHPTNLDARRTYNNSFEESKSIKSPVELKSVKHLTHKNSSEAPEHKVEFLRVDT